MCKVGEVPGRGSARSEKCPVREVSGEVSVRGCVRRGCVRRGCVRRGCVRRGCVRRGCVRRGCVRRGCVRRGCVRRRCVQNTTEEEFKRRLRIKRETFEYILGKIRLDIKKSPLI